MAASFSVDDLLAVRPPPRHADVTLVDTTTSAAFTWNYTNDASTKLGRLYAKATASQWRAEDLPWDTEVDPEKLDLEPGAAVTDVAGTVLETWDAERWRQFSIESRRWMLSQFLHGEQGALLCSAKLVEEVPDYQMKLAGAAQVIDEARHVDVFARYLNDKLEGGYDVNVHLFSLLDDILVDKRWDLTYLGMQIMVEGLALAAFGYMHATTTEPLLKQLLRQVMADEARHVAFGTIALKDIYSQLNSSELQDRAEFAFEASLRMRDRLLQQEVWERFEAPLDQVLPITANDPARIEFQRLLFSKIVPNCSKLGLLDANDSWLRHRFEDLGVAHFEHMPDEHDPDLVLAQ